MVSPLLVSALEGSRVEKIAAEIGLTLGEFISLDWDIDFIDGPVVIFNGESPSQILDKIKGLDNYSVRIPSALLQ